MIIASHKEPAKDSTLQLVIEQAEQVQVAMARIDEPPAYVPSQHIAASANRPVPPLPHASHNTSNQRSKPESAVTNYLFMKTRQEPVTGLFRIDPELQTVALDKAGATAIDRRGFNRSHRQKHRHHSRKGFKKRKDLPDPNAIFETRQGAMQLDLSIVATPHATHSRAIIQATTRQGPVNIQVHDIHPRRRLNMEVASRNGDVLVLIPRSFSGYIQLYSRHGRLVFLPNLAYAMTLVSRFEREAQVVVGDAINCSPAKGTEWAGDMMHIASRHGNIFIGYVGEDHKPAAEPGFWKKLTDMFHS